MGFKISDKQLTDQLSHKLEILRLIKNTNNTISEFNELPTLIDPYTKQTNYTVQAQSGKKIALAVQVLLINSRSILPPKFFKDLKQENRFKEAFKEPYQFLSDEPTTQYKGIIKIIAFYSMLLDALYSLPDFSDIIMMNTKKQKREAEGITEQDEEQIFEI